MKKVLFVATISSHIKSFHLPYLKLFKDNGYKVYVAASWNLGKDEKLPNCDEFIQIPIQRSPYSTKNISAIKQLKKKMLEEKFDIVHCHTPMGAVVARMAAKKARKKYGTRVIYTAHGFHFYNGASKKNWLMFYPVEKYLAKYTDTLITINQEDYNRAKSKFSKRCKDIQYVPGVGIDLNKFNIKMTKADKKKYRESLGLTEKDFVLICVGRLDRNKNQGFLINVVEQLIKDIPNIHLVLAGRDELNGCYQKMVKDKNLEKNVHFLGNRNDVPQLMHIADVAVSASQREGLPVNVIEAFASGLPVVALNCRGMSDLVENNKNGFIIDIEKNNDIMLDNYSSSILNVIKNNTKIDKKILIDDKFKIENVEKKMESVYFER